MLHRQNDEAAMLQEEKEAEKMIVEAYAALLLAFLSTERFYFLHSFISIYCYICLLHILKAKLFCNIQ